MPVYACVCVFPREKNNYPVCQYTANIQLNFGAPIVKNTHYGLYIKMDDMTAHERVTIKCLLLVAGNNIGHQPRLLRVIRWDMEQTK